MIGLDTNVLVRYVAQDDEVQSAKATALIESCTPLEPGFVTMISVVELVWVLQTAYKTPKERVVECLTLLLRTKELMVERADVVWQAVRLFTGTNIDFADALIARTAYAAGCTQMVTFDRKVINAGVMQGL